MTNRMTSTPTANSEADVLVGTMSGALLCPACHDEMGARDLIDPVHTVNNHSTSRVPGRSMT